MYNCLSCFERFLGYRLPWEFVKSNHSVHSSLDCGHLCLEKRCRSGFSFKKKKKKNEVNCLLTNIPIVSEDNKRDESWEYYKIISGCQVYMWTFENGPTKNLRKKLITMLIISLYCPVKICQEQIFISKLTHTMATLTNWFVPTTN